MLSLLLYVVIVIGASLLTRPFAGCCKRLPEACVSMFVSCFWDVLIGEECKVPVESHDTLNNFRQVILIRSERMKLRLNGLIKSNSCASEDGSCYLTLTVFELLIGWRVESIRGANNTVRSWVLEQFLTSLNLAQFRKVGDSCVRLR